MLSLLRVQNLAIIDSLELELGPGLNIVTGETGAGKSILVGALQLVLGGRGRSGLVRSGANRAEIEALFDLSPDAPLRAALAAQGVLVDQQLVVRRTVSPTGRTRAYLNGSLATAAQLSTLAKGLVDISSQHQHHSLSDPASHLRHLDAYGGLDTLRVEVGDHFTALVDAERALEAARVALRERAAREDLLRFQLQEIQAIEPRPQELQEARAELDRLRHADALSSAASGAERTLWDREGAICDELASAAQRLRDAARFDETLGDFADRIDGARAELEETARDLSRYGATIEADPTRLQLLEDRQHALQRMVRKHGDTLADVFAFRDSAEAELADLDAGEARIDSATRALDDATRALRTRASALSAGRTQAAGSLARGITAELSGLGMGDARVLVSVAPRPGATGRTLDGAGLTATGVDRVEFLIAPNPGEPPRPLAQVASGGELSRALLALKGVLAGLGPGGLYVFDEVDTGVGGAVAEVIGRKLAQLGRHHQVLCITHLPQVAVYGDHHFFISKATTDGRTASHAGLLDATQRTHEIARMLGGIEISDVTLAAASELLTGACASQESARDQPLG